MTFSEFKKRAAAISAKTFKSTTEDLIQGGIQRCLFEEDQARRLIALALQADTKTAKKQKLIWEKRLKRKAAVRLRFIRLSEESKSLKLSPQLRGHLNQKNPVVSPTV